MKKIIFASVLLISFFVVSSCVKEAGSNEDPAGKTINVAIAGAGTQKTRGQEVTTGNIEGYYKLWVFQQKDDDSYDDVHADLSAGIDVEVSTIDETNTGYLWPTPQPANLTYFALYPNTVYTMWEGYDFTDGYSIWGTGAEEFLQNSHKVTLGDEDTPPSMELIYALDPDVAMGQSELGYVQMENLQDLLIAYGSSSWNPLPIHFQHALSRVTFQIYVTDNDDVKLTNMKVDRLELSGVYLTRKLKLESYTTNNDRVVTEWNPDPVWSSFMIDEDSDYSSDECLTNISTADNLGYVFTNIETPSPGFYIGDDSGNDSFFVIPMDDLSNVTVRVRIAWDGNEEGSSYVVALPRQNVTKWEIGKHINYVLKFNASKEGQWIIVSSVSVQPWGDPVDGGEVELEQEPDPC